MHRFNRLKKVVGQFFRQHWIGIVVISLATLIFFWPIVTRISSYSEGGDAMFNAWTLARDHHCILRQDCPSYADGNIFFPHKDSMYYSESQLSAGLITLPLYFINQNPIFAYNVWMITSFFLMGFCMYLLAKYLSKNNEAISILAALLFEFSPFRMPAIAHMQNISIFYLPLAFLLIFKFLDTKKRAYLGGLFVVLALQFYASWYQMVFVLIAVGVLLAGLLLFKLEKWRTVLPIFLVTCLATISTLPLAKGYVNFSKTSDASFSLQSQAEYSSSLLDYVTPIKGTLLGDLVYKLKPSSHINSYDSDSYSYYGMTLYALAVGMIVLAYKQRKRGKQALKKYKMLLIFTVIAILGFIVSLGPLLKIRDSIYYSFSNDGLKYVIPGPYILVDKFLPQLSFMRALGRSGVLILFSLCCMLALVPASAKKVGFYINHKRLINAGVVALIIFELAPFHQMPMRTTAYSYNLSVPAVYKFIKSHKDIDNIIILSGDWDYPDAGIPIKLPEQVLWAGYHNKNIFNGYSGYLPPVYYPQFYDFVDFQKDDVPKLKQANLRYVLVDKLLSSTRPGLAKDVSSVLGSNHKVYEDKRYVLFKV